MESLAYLYVTLVLTANSLFPSSNLARHLAVDVGQSRVLAEETSSDVGIETETTTSGTVRTRKFQVSEVRATNLEEARRIKEEALTRIRETRRAAMEDAKTSREEFQERLRELRDARKRQVVERIDANIARHNEKWVEHWNRVLSRLREILAKIETRTDRLAEEGIDVSAVRAAISSAEAAIEAAQAAIDAQAGKTYVMTIGSEDTLGENVSSTVRQFKEDIKTVIETVRAAREAVRGAFMALKELLPSVPSPTP